MGDIRIVRADLADPRQAVDFTTTLAVYARDAMGGGKDLPADVQARLVEAARACPQLRVLLAYDGSECVGLTTLVEGFSTFAAAPLLNVHDMVVVASHRGRGLSHALLAEAERIARERGCCKLTLEVLSGNSIAMASYRKFGFSAYVLDPTAGEALFWQKPLE